jgi:hypothetical protein
MAAMPSLLREYLASTEASSSGVTFGRSAALGGGTNASPVTFIIEDESVSICTRKQTGKGLACEILSCAPAP